MMVSTDLWLLLNSQTAQRVLKTTGHCTIRDHNLLLLTGSDSNLFKCLNLLSGQCLFSVFVLIIHIFVFP